MENAQLVDVDKEFYNNLKKAYDEFNEAFSSSSYNPGKINELYHSLREATICALNHYMKDSMLSRDYYAACLRFKELENELLEVLKSVSKELTDYTDIHAVINCSSYMRVVESKLMDAITPTDEDFDRCRERIEICRQVVG